MHLQKIIYPRKVFAFKDKSTTPNIKPFTLSHERIPSRFPSDCTFSLYSMGFTRFFPLLKTSRKLRKGCKKISSDKVDPYICPTRQETVEILKAAEVRKQVGSKSAIKDWIFVKTDLNTGFRRSEINNLKCKHVLLLRGEIHIAFGKTPASRRVLPLNEETLANIQEYRSFKIAWGEGWGPEEPFLRSPIGKTHYDNSALYRSFKRVMVLVQNIEHPERFRPHSMRHAFSTALYENTLDIKLVSEFLGHTSIATTARIYIHLFDRERRRDAVQNLYSPHSMHSLHTTRKTAVQDLYSSNKNK